MPVRMSDSTEQATTVGCDNCGAVLQIAPNERTANCPYCDHPSVVPGTASPDRPAPTFALGFVLNQNVAFAKAASWIKSTSLFARSDFRKAPLEKIRSVYLPAYLYGSLAETAYSAQIGEDYTETETYTTTDSEGNTTTETRTVTKTEWRSLSGQHDSYVRDIIVTASRVIPNDELEAVEPFDLRALRRYDMGMVSGWTCEEPSLSQGECFSLAHDEALATVSDKLGSFMPGDSHRELRFQTRLHDEVIDLMLLPLWVFAVNYDPKKAPVRIIVNGQTGKVGGSVPLSVVKITLTVLLFVGAAIGIYLGTRP